MLNAEDRQVAQALADIATIGILQERALKSGHVVLSQLQTALESRVVIEQAKGILAEHNHIAVDEAFVLLRGYARNKNRSLRDTAADVIHGVLAAAALVPLNRRDAVGNSSSSGTIRAVRVEPESRTPD